MYPAIELRIMHIDPAWFSLSVFIRQDLCVNREIKTIGAITSVSLVFLFRKIDFKIRTGFWRIIASTGVKKDAETKKAK